MKLEDTELIKFEAELNEKTREFVKHSIAQALQYGMPRELISDKAFLAYMYGMASVEVSKREVKDEDLEAFENLKSILRDYLDNEEKNSIGSR